jgi:hypothetical protein
MELGIDPQPERERSVSGYETIRDRGLVLIDSL